MRPYKSVPVLETELGSLTACATRGNHHVLLGCSSGLIIELELPESLDPQQLVHSSLSVAKCQVFPLANGSTASGGFSALRTTVAALRATEPGVNAVVQLLAGVPPLENSEILAVNAGGEVVLIDTSNWRAVDNLDDVLLNYKVLAKHAFAVATTSSDPTSILVGQRRRLLQLQRQGSDWQPGREVTHGSVFSKLIWLGKFAVVTGENDVVVVDMDTGNMTTLPSTVKTRKECGVYCSPRVVPVDNEEIFIASADTVAGGTMGLFLNVRTTQTAPKPLFCSPHLYSAMLRVGPLIAGANTADELELLSCGDEGASVWQTISLPAAVTAVAAFKEAEHIHAPIPFIACTQSTVWCLLPVPWTDQVRKLTMENRFEDTLNLVCMASNVSERRARFEVVNALAFWRFITLHRWAAAFRVLRVCPMQLPLVAELLKLWRSQLPMKFSDDLTHWRNFGRSYTKLPNRRFANSEPVAKYEDLLSLGLTLTEDSTIESEAQDNLQEAHTHFLSYLLELRGCLIDSLLRKRELDNHAELHRGLDVILLDSDDSVDDNESAFVSYLSDWRNIMETRKLSGSLDFDHFCDGTGLSVEQRRAGTLLIDLGVFLLLVDAVVTRLSITIEEMQHGHDSDATAAVWSLVEPSNKQFPYTKHSCFSTELISKAGAEIAADVVNLAAETVCFRVWREQTLKDSFRFPLTSGPEVALKGHDLDLARHSATEVNWAMALSNCRCEFENSLRGSCNTLGKQRGHCRRVAQRWAAALLNLCCRECNPDDEGRRRVVKQYLPPLLRWDEYVGLQVSVVLALGSLPVVQQQLRPGERVVTVCSSKDNMPIMSTDELLHIVNFAAEDYKLNLPLLFLLLVRAGAKSPGKFRGGPPLSRPLTTRLISMLMREVQAGLRKPLQDRSEIFTRPQLITLMEVDREVVDWPIISKQALEQYEEIPTLVVETALCFINAEGLESAVKWLVKGFEPARMALAETFCQAANHGIFADVEDDEEFKRKPRAEQLPMKHNQVGTLVPPYFYVAPLASLVEETGELNDTSFWARLGYDWREPALCLVASDIAQRQAGVRALRLRGPAAAELFLQGQPDGFDVLADEPVGVDAPFCGAVLVYVKALIDCWEEGGLEDGMSIITSVLQKYSTHADLKLSSVLPFLPNNWSLHSVLPFMVRSCAAESALKVERAALTRQAALAFLHSWAAVEAAKRKSFLVAREDVCGACSKRLSVSRRFSSSSQFVWDPTTGQAMHAECCPAAVLLQTESETK